MRNWLVTTQPKQSEFYNQMLIQSDLRVHEQAIGLVTRYVPKNSRILDLGAGTGAFSKRLADSGYSVIAIDGHADQWIPKEIPLIRQDIDLGIADSTDVQFDAVCCLEVIEHVENPWKLLREIAKLLRPKGVVILSTPNVTSFLSRLIFLRTGQFHQFSGVDLSYGHIRPVTAFELTLIADRLGLQILETSPGGYLPVFDLSSFGPKSLVFNILRGLAYIFAKGQKHGWCLFFVLEKP